MLQILKGKILIFIIVLFGYTAISAQTIAINSVFPGQDVIGLSKYTQVIVELNTPLDSLTFQVNKLFHIYGSNSGLKNGTIEADTNNNKIIFTPDKPFYCGEVVNVTFGPLFDDNNNEISFHWRFTIGILNPTNANFDSLRRFEYPSFGSIAIDFDNDGDIDIVSRTGRVIYNDGTGSFNSYEEIPELQDLKYFIDVNNDKNLDIITSLGNVFLGDSLGNYTLYQSINEPLIANGDINGDGFVDLIAKDDWGWNGQNFLWNKLINDGTGKFIIDTASTYLQNYISEADLVDMDKDGDLDLVLLNTWPSEPGTQFDGAYIYYNNGKGDFNDSLKTWFNIYPYDLWLNDLRQLFIIDYNLDGLNDIAGFGSQNGGLVILQEDSNLFNGYAETSFSGAENFGFFTSGDINGDNRFDLIQSNWQVCLECGNDVAEVRMETFLNFDPIDFWSDTSSSTYQLGTRSDVGVAVVPILADVDNDGDLDVIHTGYPTTITYNENVVTEVDELNQLPLSFSLSQNYPNPFNPSTTIEYTLPVGNTGFPDIVQLKVYDVLGKEVATLVNKKQNSGKYLVEFNAVSAVSGLASGLYFYKLTYNSKIIVKKMIYLK